MITTDNTQDLDSLIDQSVIRSIAWEDCGTWEESHIEEILTSQIGYSEYMREVMGELNAC